MSVLMISNCSCNYSLLAPTKCTNLVAFRECSRSAQQKHLKISQLHNWTFFHDFHKEDCKKKLGIFSFYFFSQEKKI